jgi:PAS domain S-box-containing protein
LLRQKEEELLLAQRSGHIGLWSRDLTTGESSTSPEWNELMGFPRENATVSLAHFLERVHPDDRPSMRARPVTLPEENFEAEFRIVHPSKGERWILSRGSRTVSVADGHLRMMGGLIDITERKQAEKALRDLNEQLDQRVSQRTRELAESQARLRSLVAELTRAEERERRRLAVELHDYLAQSLTALRMDLSRADKLMTTTDGNGVLRKILYDVRNDLDHSIDYTRSLIAELSPRVLYDLGLPAALAWLAEQMGKHGLHVEVDGNGEGISLTEDEAVFIYQCARELLWNVVKHADTDRAKVAFGVDGKQFSLAVIDDGIGFDPQAKVDDGGGRGHFGLFSIKERVELRGGQVEIESKPGSGTWVTLLLPIDSRVEAAVKMEKSEAAASALGKNIKIVIVDDHQTVRRGLRRVLEEESPFTIVGEAGDGPQAIAMTKELEPNVVIMDVNLPTMSGIEATSRIMHDRPSTIVIGLSFGSDSYLTQAMRDAGAVSCVAKERAVEEVSQAIITALREREAPSGAGA